jgi:sec-independent protein translocase protein TatB
MPLLDNLDGWKLLVLFLVAVFVIGPDKLPKAISDGVRMLRNLRDMARGATRDLSRELGTEITLEDLNPKTLLRKHLLSEEEEQALRRPVEDLYRTVREDVRGVGGELKDTKAALRTGPALADPAPAASVAASEPTTQPRRTFDIDAT